MLVRIPRLKSTAGTHPDSQATGQLPDLRHPLEDLRPGPERPASRRPRVRLHLRLRPRNLRKPLRRRPQRIQVPLQAFYKDSFRENLNIASLRRRFPKAAVDAAFGG